MTIFALKVFGVIAAGGLIVYLLLWVLSWVLSKLYGEGK